MLRGYLVDATYEWLVDHGFTPYVLVDTEFDGVQVPTAYIDEDQSIVLNLDPNAIQNYRCTDRAVMFEGSFNGEVMQITLPIESIVAIYSEETEQGIYAREYGYGMMVNEGADENEVNPKPVGGPDNNGGGFSLV